MNVVVVVVMVVVVEVHIVVVIVSMIKIAGIEQILSIRDCLLGDKRCILKWNVCSFDELNIEN